MQTKPKYTPAEVIAYARECVEALHAKGGMTREERAVAHGNLDEAAAKLRLAEAKK